MAADYEKLYFYLFNRITDALEELEKGRSETARLLLVSAQQAAEEMFVESCGSQA